ncbi:uncharacterized protein LOC131849502 [Achroia grisella]|uniref:uncharacterized protein LOC131849502 n=1 Tax=Achroia grisella TaxID=688607 RepID=UPI0027D34C47|nr:uncharacterized protein LOC131849502 [Achroia grisella]
MQTPKEIFQKRVTKSHLMKIPFNERNINSNEENYIPQEFHKRNNKFKLQEKNVAEHGTDNPFDLPPHSRLFSHKRLLRKIKPEPFIMSETRAICDIDNNFYNIIEGRSIRQFVDVKVYMGDIRDITLFKANAAYLEDQVIQLDSFYTFELTEYNEINTLFKKCKDNFIQCAKDSYCSAKNLQMEAEVKALEIEKVTEELEALSSKYVTLRNKLSDICANFDTLSRYRQFLNSLTPLWWQAQYGPKFMGRDLFSYTASNIFSSSEISLVDSKVSLKMFKDVQLQLYFKKPDELMSIFENLCNQCLNYLNIEIFTKKILKIILNNKDILQARLHAELNELQEYIYIYSDLVKFTKEKEVHYKTVFEKILMNEFQNLFSSYDTIKLFTCLQYTHRRIFNTSEDPKDNIATLMLNMELLYIELTSGLDNLNQDVVKQATDEFFSKDLKNMTRAHKAQRSLKECDILMKALYASFEPPRRKYK